MKESDFLYPRSTYRGLPQHSSFNVELQRFSQRLSTLCALEANGKIPQELAYQQIEALWTHLEDQHCQGGESKVG